MADRQCVQALCDMKNLCMGWNFLSEGFPDWQEAPIRLLGNISEANDPFSWKTGAHFWRTQRDGSLLSLTPARIKHFWNGLPPDTDRIDAVYERKSDSRIIFFIGRLSAAFQESAVQTRQLGTTSWRKHFLKLNEDLFGLALLLFSFFLLSLRCLHAAFFILFDLWTSFL